MNTLYNTSKLHPAWVVGFIDGEGTFFIDIPKNATIKLGYQVMLQFAITQHIRDAALMLDLQEFFGCGTIANDGTTKKQFRIRNIEQVGSKLLPLFDMYPLRTQKSLDMQSFYQVYNMMKQGLHLTPEGLEEIRAIKATMNRARMAQYVHLYTK